MTHPAAIARDVDDPAVYRDATLPPDSDEGIGLAACLAELIIGADHDLRHYHKDLTKF
ncbi:MAG: hypothetical protein NVS3B5_22970 [Sphingomicrobium sp.]